MDEHIDRTAVKRLVAWVLLPLAAVLALGVGYAGLMRMTDLWVQFCTPTLLQLPPPFPQLDTFPRLPFTTTARQRLARLDEIRIRHHGDDVPQYLPRFYAQWQASRGTTQEKISYARYANAYPTPKQVAGLPPFTKAMRRGMTIDPDNAFYHYRLAQAYLSLGMDYQEYRSTGELKVPVHPYAYTYCTSYTSTVRDRRLLDQGVAELREALA